MAVCFIAYQQDGFWFRDEAMLVWGAMLAGRLEGLAASPAPTNDWARQDWAVALAATWRQLATHSFEQVTMQLGDYLETAERRAALLALGEGCRDRLVAEGLSALSGLAAGVAEPLRSRDPEGACGRVLRAADAFLWLLGGRREALPSQLEELFAAPVTSG